MAPGWNGYIKNSVTDSPFDTPLIRNMGTTTTIRAELLELSDEQVIERVINGDTAIYELLVRRYNQRVYRAVRAVLRDDNEAEDVMQEAYVRAFQHLARFEHRASFCTWITRIAVNEALARIERAGRYRVQDIDEDAEALFANGSAHMNPEETLASTEARALLEEAILALPLTYRTVIMLRDVEEMSTAEVAEALDLTADAIKVRLHRARALLRRELYARAGVTSASAFQFHATRCDRVSAAVMVRVSILEGK